MDVSKHPRHPCLTGAGGTGVRRLFAQVMNLVLHLQIPLTASSMLANVELPRAKAGRFDLPRAGFSLSQI